MTALTIFGITATVFALLATVFGYLRGQQRPARTIWLSVSLCFSASAAALVGIFNPVVESSTNAIALIFIMASLVLTFAALRRLGIEGIATKANYKYFAVKS